MNEKDLPEKKEKEKERRKT
jgi:hypothetical protein